LGLLRPGRGDWWRPARGAGIQRTRRWPGRGSSRRRRWPREGRSEPEPLQFAAVSFGKHGGKHRDCGQKCLKNGQPIGLLTSDGKLYLLMEEEHDPRRDGLTNFRQAAIDHMAYIMEVTGTLTETQGQRALYVSGFVKK